MVDSTQHLRVETTNFPQADWLLRLCPWFIAFVTLTSCGLLPGATGAAERPRLIRIGALTDSWGPTPSMTGLRHGLLELGYREREDFVLGVRFTKGDTAALPTAARQLVQHKVDLIFADSNDSARAAQKATTQIPIVFAGVEDPIGAKLVQTFARPGANLTGVATLDTELSPKRLQTFQEIVPGLKRVLFLYAATDVHSEAAARVYRDAARRLGIVLVEQAVRTEEEVQTELAQVRQRKVDGILAPRCCTLNLPGTVLQATTQQGIPTMFNAAFWSERGALASYGPGFYESGYQAARLVDKILKGVKPSEIPVEVNSNIELVINLKTAKALGLTIAPEVLFQANKIVR